jgi:hypothetical protein
MEYRKITEKDRETLRKYAELRENIGELLEEVRERVLEEYRVRSDGMRHEGDRYTYLLFEAKGVEFSPGVIYSEDSVIKPVFWVSKNAFREESPEDHGFRQDPEFPNYDVRELRLDRDFFKLSADEQAEKIIGFYLKMFEKFYEMALVDKTQRFYFAG